ncbi:MAG: hypothetical protein ACREC0_03445 [Methylocella sp.]
MKNLRRRVKPSQCRGPRLERKEARRNLGIILHRNYAPKKGFLIQGSKVHAKNSE